MSADNKVSLEFEADISGATEGFRKVEDGLDDVAKAAEKTGSFFDKLKSEMSDRFVITAGDVVNAIGSIVSTLGQLPGAIQAGSGIDDITASFEDLAGKAGVVGDTLINKFSKALGDTIPKVQLMQQANELLIGGLDPKDFDIVAKSARALGEATGVSAAEGMNALSDSLLRGNTRALKSIGVILDSEQAQLKYAQSLGVTVDKLTEVDRVEAIRSATIEALRAKTGELAEVTDDAGDKIDQLAAAFQNQKDQALRALGTNSDVVEILDKLKTAAGNVELGKLAADLITITAAAANAALKIAELVVKFSGLGQKVSDLAGIISKAKIAYTGLFGTEEEKKILAIQLAFSKIGVTLNETSSGARENADALKAAGDAAKAAADKANEQARADKGRAEKLKEATDRQKEITEFTKRYADALKKQAEELAKTVTESDAYEDVLGDIANGSIDAATAGERIKAIYTQMTPLLGELNALQSEQLRLQQEIARGRNVSAADLGNIAADIERVKAEIATQLGATSDGGLFTDLLFGPGGMDAGQAAVAGKIGDALANAISSALSSGDVESGIKAAGVSLGQALGSTAGATLGPIGAAVGGAMGQALADRFIKGVSGLGKSSLGTGKGIKTIVDSIFPGIGSGIDAILGDKLFGGDSEGTATRKQIDKYFADLFDANRLLLVINGELQQIKDFDFGGGLFGQAESSAAQFFQTLTTESQAGFAGVAQGFAQMAGLGSEAAAGLAQVFSENLGGSLNNLQLLIESTGLSFDQMREATVNAFLAGKLSALEAQTALNGIAQVSQKGIPDGIGQISQAFDNMKAAGTKGGRALIDALQDIGFEAKELGQTELTQVIASLTATGKYSAEEIQQVFNALKNAGITSVDQLTSATTEQLLPVLAQLESTEFPFAEKARELVETLNQIPDSKDFEFNVKVNYQSSADQQVVQTIASGSRGQGEARL